MRRRTMLLAALAAMALAAGAWGSFTSSATMVAVVPAEHVAVRLSELSSGTDTGSGSLSGYLKRNGSTSYAATGSDSGLAVNLGAIGDHPGTRQLRNAWSVKALAPVTVRVQVVSGSVSFPGLSVSTQLASTHGGGHGQTMGLAAGERAWVDLTVKVSGHPQSGAFTTVRIELVLEGSGVPAGFLSYRPAVGMTFSDRGPGADLPGDLAPAAPPWAGSVASTPESAGDAEPQRTTEETTTAETTTEETSTGPVATQPLPEPPPPTVTPY